MREIIIERRGYDPDIDGDELSLKIASYPEVARYLAKRLKGKGATLCELCCGIGVGLLEFTEAFDSVIGVDYDFDVLHDCKKNLDRAGKSNFKLICGDVADQKILDAIEADIVLYDIPYWNDPASHADSDEQNPDLKKLVTAVRGTITSKICIYVPTDMSYAQVVAELGECEYVELYIDQKHDRNIIFLGELIERPGKSKVTL